MGKSAKFAFGIAASTVAALMAFAQESPTLRARELFYKNRAQPAVSTQAAISKSTGGTAAANPTSGSGDSRRQNPVAVVPVAASPLAMRYRLLRQTGNRLEEVDTDTTFSSGDKIKVSVATNEPAYLYIFHIGSSGSGIPLFPSAEIEAPNNRTKSFENVEIPSNATFEFDSTPGVEQLFIVASREAIADLEEVLSRSRKTQPEAVPPDSTRRPVAYASNDSGVTSTMLSNIRNQVRSRDLIVSKVDTVSGNSREHAIYVANAEDATGPVIADFKLIHRP